MVTGFVGSGDPGVEITRNVELRLKDGTVLRADLYRPRGADRPLATLVSRTPYGKHQDARSAVARDLASRGFLVVLQDQRGRYASDGEFRWMWRPYDETNDAEDGYETVEWAARLPGSDGRVGAYGHSNDGWAAWVLLSRRPPSLRAAAVSGMSPNSTDISFGIFETGRRLQWIYEMAVDVRVRQGKRDGPVTPMEATRRWRAIERGKFLWWLPLSTLPREAVGELGEQYQTLLEECHREFMCFPELYDRVEVPILHLTGWWDRFSDAIDHLPGLMQRSDHTVRHLHRLVVGPWGHGYQSHHSVLEPVGWSASDEPTYAELLGDWFDAHLDADGDGNLPRGGARLFVLGEDRWLESPEWPPAGMQPTSYFLDSLGSANTADGNGVLRADKPPFGADSDTFVYDPRDPLMSLSDVDCQVVPADHAQWDFRSDVLVYESDPMSDDLLLIGPVCLQLWAGSDAPDTDWTATLAVAFPEGPVINLSYGACRARYRHGFDQPRLLTSDHPEQYEIPMRKVGCLVHPGQRLRLYVSSSNFPDLDRNHNTGRDYARDSELQRATQRIFHSRSMPSRLVLPVVR